MRHVKIANNEILHRPTTWEETRWLPGKATENGSTSAHKQGTWLLRDLRVDAAENRRPSVSTRLCSDRASGSPSLMPRREHYPAVWRSGVSSKPSRPRILPVKRRSEFSGRIR